MEYAVILLLVCQIITFVGVSWYIRLWAEKRQRDIERRINAELAKLVAGEACQSGAVFNAIGQLIGREAGRSAKASLMADLAHVRQHEKGAEAEQQLALLGEQNPTAADVVGAFGVKRAGKLFRNPLVQAAMAVLSGGGAGPGRATGNGGSGVASIQDRIKKGG